MGWRKCTNHTIVKLWIALAVISCIAVLWKSRNTVRSIKDGISKTVKSSLLEQEAWSLLTGGIADNSRQTLASYIHPTSATTKLLQTKIQSAVPIKGNSYPTKETTKLEAGVVRYETLFETAHINRPKVPSAQEHRSTICQLTTLKAPLTQEQSSATPRTTALKAPLKQELSSANSRTNAPKAPLTREHKSLTSQITTLKTPLTQEHSSATPRTTAPKAPLTQEHKSLTSQLTTLKTPLTQEHSSATLRTTTQKAPSTQEQSSATPRTTALKASLTREPISGKPRTTAPQALLTQEHRSVTNQLTTAKALLTQEHSSATPRPTTLKHKDLLAQEQRSTTSPPTAPRMTLTWQNNLTASELLPTLTSTTSLEHLYLAIKTTCANHDTRLKLQLMTWISLAKQSTFVFTDCDDAKYQSGFEVGHFINTKCGSSHQRADLVCKTSMEYNHFLLVDRNKRWFCGLDDDNYVNIPNLIKFLSDFDHSKKFYIGKISRPKHPSIWFNKGSVSFQFATGGAMWCISKALATAMIPYAAGEGYNTFANQQRLTDDVAIGFTITHFARTNLTECPLLHSHLEQLSNISVDALKDQITLSYAWRNVINTTGLTPSISVKDDPTRLLTLHSYLFPRP